MRPVRLLTLSAVTLLVLAAGAWACAEVPPSNEPDSAGEANSPDPPASDGLADEPDTAAPDSAASTAPRAYTLDEALAADVDGPILVTGLLIDAGDGWRLCAAIAESYPPQCGGASVTVTELDPADHDLHEAGGVRWSEGATLFGELRGDAFTVTGPASAA